MRKARTLIYLLLCLLIPAPASCWAENLKVLVVLSDSSTPYLSFASALSKGLPPSVQTSVLESPERLSSGLYQADLVVAVGMKATEFAASKITIPMLSVMIPKMGYEEMLARVSPKTNHRPISAIYIDQQWDRQIEFWRAVFPERRRIGLLHSQDTNVDLERLRKNVAQRGGSLKAQPVQSAGELFSRLESVLTNSDVLIAIPDSTIYNSSNIRNILLTSYRYGIPLIGFSQSYVNAGAMCAIFSTPEQLAEQASEVMVSFARTGHLSEPQYPATYTIAINQQVARSLGVKLPPHETIRERMGKTKEGE